MKSSIQSRPAISVILPTLNGDAYIQSAVSSILWQTWSDFELLVVDGGSTDETLSILERIRDHRLRIFHHPKGLAGQLNFGIAQARGCLLARMDADDVALANRLARQRSFMLENPQIGVCGTAMSLLGVSPRAIPVRQEHQDIVSTLLLRGNCLAHPTVMINRELLERTGLRYREEAFPIEDYQLWLDLAPHTTFANLNEVHLFYRVHSRNVSRRNFHRQIEMTRAVVRKNISEIGNLDPEVDKKRLHALECFFRGELLKLDRDCFQEIHDFLGRAESLGLKVERFREELRALAHRQDSGESSLLGPEPIPPEGKG